MNKQRKAMLDNYSKQKNPNNDAYWKSRGYKKRPANWQDIIRNKNSVQKDPKWNAYWKIRRYINQPANRQGAVYIIAINIP